MARVPQYQQQVAPTVTPNVRRSDNNASAEDFGGGLAKAAGAFAGVAQQIAKREQEKADTAAQMEIENGLAALETQTLYDPDKGMLNRQGKDAIGLGQQFAPAWEQGAAGIVGKAPRHLQAWAQQQAERQRTMAMRRVQSHSMEQANKYYIGQADSMFSSAADTAILNYNDPERVDDETARGMLAVDRKADLLGVDDITRQQMRQEAMSGIQRGVLERIVEADPIAADARFQAVRSRLTGVDAAAIEDKLRPLLRANEYEAVADVVESGGAPTVNVVPPPRGQPTPEIRNAIESAAAKYGIDPAYLYALCEQESSFNPRAVNKESGAAGLFQYIPGTAQDRGIDPFDIQQACEAAAKDFAERMKAGGPQEAMASHFAGPGGGNRGKKTAAYVAEVTGRTMRWRGDAEQPREAAPPATLGDALDRIKSDPRYDNPVWREGVTAAIERRWRVKERDEADRDQQMLESMRERVNNAPIGASMPQILGSDYSVAATKGWLDSLASIAKAKAEGRLIQTNPITYDKFARLLATNPAEFAKPQTMRDIGAAAGELATADYKKLREDWEDLQKSDKPAKDYANDTQRIDRGVLRLNLTTDIDKARFGMAYRQAVQAYVIKHNEQPGPTEADAILNTVMMNYATASQKDKTSKYASAEKYGPALAGKVSREDYNTARDRLIARGNKNPSEAQVIASMDDYYRTFTNAD